MYKAPSIQQPRQIFDSHGHLLGRSDGFRPDPVSGGLGIELELVEEAQSLLDTDRTRAWLSTDAVDRVREDRMVLAITLRELRVELRERSLWSARPLSPEQDLVTET